MKPAFKEPKPQGYIMLIGGLATRDKAVPVPGEYDPADPAAVRAAYERDFSGPANGPTGGYFQMLMFLANVEGRMGYAPGALTNAEKFEEIVDLYWQARCRHGIVAAEASPAPPVAPSPAPGC